MKYVLPLLSTILLLGIQSLAQEVPDSIAPDTGFVVQPAIIDPDSLLAHPDSTVRLSPEDLRMLRNKAVGVNEDEETGIAVSDIQHKEQRSEFVSQLDIDNNDDFSSFAMLDSVVDDFRVFFIGENHTFRVTNQKLQLKMLRYLYYTAGVRTLLLEFGYSSGWLMNQYVQTGDSTLYNIFDIYAYKAWADFVRDLAEFNLSLDSNDRIEVIGIDVERFKSIPLKVLTLQIPDDKPIPEEISLSVESLVSMVRYLDADAEDDEEDFFFSYDTYDVGNHVAELVREYDSLRTYFIDYLGPERFQVFDSTMVTLRHHLVYEGYKEKRLPQAFIYRERYMFDQFTRVLQRKPEGKFFAQFGRCHVGTLLQEEACSWHNFNSVANRINNSPDSLINGQVCTIGTFYPNSESFNDESDEISRLDDIVAMAEDKGLTLIGVMRGNEIFDELTDMYDYVIINQSTPQEEAEAEAVEIVSDFFDDFDTQGHFIVGAGYAKRITDFTSLNDALNTFSPDYEFGYVTSDLSFDFGYNFEGIYTKFNYRQTLPMLIMDGEDEVLGLRRWGLNYSFGFGDLTRKSGLSMHVNAGYERMTLEVDESINPTSGGTSIFGNDLNSKYSRDAFVLGAQLGYHINLFEYVPIQVFGGYNLDVSNPKWKVRGAFAENGPDTRLDGFYAGIGLIILIPEGSE